MQLVRLPPAPQAAAALLLSVLLQVQVGVLVLVGMRLGGLHPRATAREGRR